MGSPTGRRLASCRRNELMGFWPRHQDRTQGDQENRDNAPRSEPFPEKYVTPDCDATIAEAQKWEDHA